MLFRLQLRSALRVLALWLVIGSLNAGILVGLLAVRAAAQHRPMSAGEITAIAWLGVALYLAVSGSRHRASMFELTLPLSARQLWLTHAATVLAMAAVLGLAAALAATAQVRILSMPGSLGIGTVHLAALLASGAVLAVALLELPARQLHRIPFSARTLTWTMLVLAVISVVLGVLPPLGPAGVLLPASLGGVLGWLMWRSLPPSFTVFSCSPAGANAADMQATWTSAPDASVATRAGRARRAVRWTLLRSLAGGPKDAIAYPMLLIFGLILGGALGAWSGDADTDDLRFLYLPMATYVLFALTGPRLATLHQLDALPIARQRILAWLLLPHLGCFLLGYGGGALAAHRHPVPFELVQLVEWRGTYHLQVPVWAQALARADQVPEIAVPGGEAHRPRALPLWKGARFVMYSPYDTPAGSSPHYVAEQISRAAAALYGAAMPADEIAARYLDVRADGSVAPKPGGLRLRADHPELRPRAAGPMFPFFTALAAVPWLLLVAGLFRAYRSDIGPARAQQLVWGFIVAFVLLFIGQGMLMVRGIIKPWAPHALLGIAARHLGSTPMGLVAVWFGAALLLGCAYALVRGQFRHMEVPATPLRFGLQGFWRAEN